MPANPGVPFKMGCRDGPRTREFFAKPFDWDIAQPNAGLTIQTGGESPISGHSVELAEEWGNHVMVDVQVDDLEASLAKAVELGGKALVQPVTLSGRGSFAWGPLALDAQNRR